MSLTHYTFQTMEVRNGSVASAIKTIETMKFLVCTESGTRLFQEVPLVISILTGCTAAVVGPNPTTNATLKKTVNETLEKT